MKKGILLASLLLGFQTQSHDVPPRTLKVLTYNVWGMPFPVRLGHKGLRKAPSEIPKLGADVVCMQEVFIKRAKKLRYMQGYPYAAWGAPSNRRKLKFLDSGLLCVSKYPITAVNRITYKKCSGSDCLASKGALHIRLALPFYGEVDIITTHLNAGTRKKTKRLQLAQLKKFVNQNRSYRPLLVMGDFNLKPKTSFYKNFGADFNMTDSHKSFLEVYPDAPESVRESFTYGMNIGLIKIRQRLDYVWYQQGEHQDLRVVDYRVVFSHEDHLPKLSDHYGLMVTFEL